MECVESPPHSVLGQGRMSHLELMYPGQMSKGSFINTPVTGPNQCLGIPTPGSGSDQSRDPDGQDMAPCVHRASLCSVLRRQ